MNKPDLVLSFHDAVVKRSDMSILDGPEWLNDRLIGFYFQYLEHVEYSRFEKDVAFVSPEVTQCIKLTRSSDVGVFAEPLNLRRKSLILFPVNDCLEEEAPGGTHWSLLVYVRSANVFHHYDSCRRSNQDHATDIMTRVLPYLKSNLTAPYPGFVDAPCLQQENSYDCGIHVLCNAEYVCQKYLKGSRDDISDFVTQETVAGKRFWLKNLIMALGGK